MNKPDVRAVVFGMNGLGYVVCVKPPKAGDVEACGVYIHIEDMEKFQLWQKLTEEQSDEPGTT